MKRLTYILILFSCASLYAQVPLVEPDLHSPTMIAPAYFSPNAFPVPPMLDGTTQKNLIIDLAADGYWGTMKDKNADIMGKITIPLFTDRVNLNIWLVAMEWYENSLQRQQYCRLQDTVIMKGHNAGDAYVTTDIMVLREKHFIPALTVRAGIKTASGGGFYDARFYDNPGYFFDGAIGKSFVITRHNPEKLQIRLAASAGFLCWQTDNGRQNDAVMYGALLRLKYQYLSLTTEFTGYSGWEKQGDQPMVVRADLRGHIKRKKQIFEPYLMYQYGIKDYPWHNVRIGLSYHLDILQIANEHKNGKR